MKLLWQGLIIGLSIILPGISGGTVLVILGIYERTIRDISQLHLRPYKTFLPAALAGIFLGGQLIIQLFNFYPDLTAAFFLGIILASIKAVLRERPAITLRRIFALILGFLIGFLLVDEPFQPMTIPEIPWYLLIACGAIASITMMIPGVSGSAILIMMGVYNDIIFYLKNFYIAELLIFGGGAVLGIWLFAKILEKIYARYQAVLAFLFAGLIAGSSYSMLPAAWNPLAAVIFIGGFCLVWFLEGDKKAIKN